MADFVEKFDQFKELNADILAASTDPEDKAKEMKESEDIPFELGHSLDAEAISERTGVYFKDEREYMQAAGFVLTGDGKVGLAVYSTGAAGRLRAQDALDTVKALKKKQEKEAEKSSDN